MDLIVPEKVMPFMTEKTREAIFQVKGILKDLALTTFRKYREAGQIIIDVGFSKQQGKHNPWNKEVLEYACSIWGCTPRTVYRFIELGEMPQDAFDMACQKFKSLYDWTQRNRELPEPSDFNYDIYNVWKVARLDPDQERYPGQTPQQLIENIIYYYSEEGDQVLDPMAGSGIVGIVCKNMGRNYTLYDINPIKQEIVQNDILEGFPENTPKIDLVYFDPPYYNLMTEYPDNAFTQNYEGFLEAIKISFEYIGTILTPKGKVALILKPMNADMLGGPWLDMTIDSVEIARKQGYKLIKRIMAPLSTQQFRAHDVSRAKERGVMLNTMRDIVILQKEAFSG